MPGVGPGGPRLIPAAEEISIQCAGFVGDKQDESLRVIGSEEGIRKIALASGDILYLNRGMNDGISPGDQYYLNRRTHKVDHPTRWGSAGWQIARLGWGVVLAAQERSAIFEVTQACQEIYVGDYLTPFEQIPVPLILQHEPADRLTPETGKLRGHIVASLGEMRTLGQGHLVSIDLGEQDGVIPGNVFTVFDFLYSGVQRKMLGELVVLTVQENTATTKIIHSYDIIDVGNYIELK
jgi:hypothetical protein